MSWTNLVNAARFGLANGKTNVIAKLEDIVEGADMIEAAMAGAVIAGNSLTPTEAHLLVLSNTELDNLRKVAVAAIVATNEVEVTFDETDASLFDEAMGSE